MRAITPGRWQALSGHVSHVMKDPKCARWPAMTKAIDGHTEAV